MASAGSAAASTDELGFDWGATGGDETSVKPEQIEPEPARDPGVDYNGGTLVCLACSNPRANKRTKFCIVHKRAWDSISKSAGKDKTSVEFTAFQEVAKDDIKVCKVVIDFVRDNPEGQAKKGISRGKVEWSRYVHTFRQFGMVADDDDDMKLDYESFLTRMKNVRGWDMTKADAEWELLKADPSIDRDQAGTTDFPLRLQVPANLCVSSYVKNRRGTEEGKTLELAGKSFKGTLPAAETTKIQSELGKGFSASFLQAGSSTVGTTFSSLTQALPENAITSDVEKRLAGDYLVAFASTASGSMCSVSDTASQAPSTPRSRSPQSVIGLADSRTPPSKNNTNPLTGQVLPGQQPIGQPGGAKRKFVDVQSLRNNALTKCRNSLVKVHKEMLEGLRSGHALILECNTPAAKENNNAYEAHVGTLRSRREIALAYLGKKESFPEDEKGEKVVFTDVDIQTLAAGMSPPLTKGETEDEQEFNRRVIQSKLRSLLDKESLLPVEDVTDFLPEVVLDQNLKSLAGLSSPDDINETVSKFERHKLLVGQMISGLRVAVNDLQKQLSKAKKQAKAAQDKALRDQQESAKAGAQGGVKRAGDDMVNSGKKLKLDKSKNTLTFLDLDLGQHSKIYEADFTNTMNEGLDCDVPAFIKGALGDEHNKVFGDLVGAGLKSTGKRDDFVATLAKFGLQFPTTNLAKSGNLVVAPINAAHGLEEAKQLLDQFIPSDIVDVSAMKDARLKSTSDSCMFFGYGEDNVSCDINRFGMCCAQFFVTGMFQVATMRVSEVTKFVTQVEKVEPGDSKFKERVEKFFCGLDETAMSKISELKMTLNYGTFEAPGVLVIPAGSVCAVRTLNKRKCHGFQAFYITETENAHEDLTALVGATADDLAIKELAAAAKPKPDLDDSKSDKGEKEAADSKSGEQGEKEAAEADVD